MPRITGRGKLRSLTCEECGRIYMTRGPATRFCSNKCGAVWSGRQKRSARGPVVCARCGKTFRGQIVDWENKPRRRYCSSYCYGLARRKGGDTFTCEYCGAVKPVKRLKSGGFWYAQRFCSPRCANDAQRVGFIDKHGYRVRIFGGREVREHRSVMGDVLGRPLLPYETVHHRNGVRDDNRPENLEVWIGRHTPGQRLEEALAFYVQVLTDHGFHVTPPPSQA